MDPDSEIVAIQVESHLIEGGRLGIFFDYPYPHVNNFDDPFVGIWNGTKNHATSLQQNGQQSQIRHDIDATTYFTTVRWNGEAEMSSPLDRTHRYVLQLKSNENSRLGLTVNFSPSPPKDLPSAQSISSSAASWWEK